MISLPVKQMAKTTLTEISIKCFTLNREAYDVLGGPFHNELLFGAKCKDDINGDTVAHAYPCT